MAKKSKLVEKSIRFTVPTDEKQKPEFEKYLHEIKSTNLETARALRFSMLLRDWFSDVKPDFIEEYLRGIEKYVKVKGKDFIIRGRIDALYGNAIIEFESDLRKKSSEAKKQLQAYLYCILTNKKERDVNYLCIATDGILFQVYTPWFKNPNELPNNPNEIILKELEKVDFSTIEANQAYLWIDRYFFRTKQLHPTTEEFVKDFGINSPSYSFAFKLLNAVWIKYSEKNEFKVIYENWEKYLRIAYGTSVADTELFLRHTYLATFAKLLAYMRFSGKSSVPPDDQIISIFNGKFFQQLGIQNFLEEDFFSWIIREKVRNVLIELTRGISTLLDKYHLKEISEDVLKSLYQELVDPETRHDLGEYYTPDWLAERIISHILEENPKANVLDPSCGSGSFLYFAIRYKRNALENNREALYHIRDNVVGIDIHPLAVIISKTNYLLGLGELVKTRVKDFYIPVYLADSLRLPEKQVQMTFAEKVPSLSVELDHQEALIPDVFVKTPNAFDEAIEACHHFAETHNKSEIKIDNFLKFARRAIPEIKCDDVNYEVLFSIAEKMNNLIEKDRNSIWTYILKNVYRPIFLKKKFDWIVGNPPWLSYRYVEKGKYQEFLKSIILDTYCLLQKGGGHLITHLELGTLFFCACLFEYGIKDGARIAFVLPRSIFSSDQHDNFRKTNWGKAVHQTGITEVWDLENVSPLFNVPACVIFGKRPFYTKKPIKAEVLSGDLPRRNTSLSEAINHINVRKTGLYVVQHGERSFWAEDQKAKIIKGSLYMSKFAEGATIVPRSCWFVEIASTGDLGFDPSKPYVRTDPRATKEAKPAYKDLKIEGNIEKDFLYATLLSTDLLPFGFLNYRPVVLPIKESGDYFLMITKEHAKRGGYKYLLNWLELCEQEWHNRRREKAKKESLLQWLDYRHKLSQQCHTSKYKVLYPMSATYLCATVVENEKININIEGQKIKLKHFIADYVTFFAETNTENEAQYLVAILNSPTLDNLLKPMQAKGLWGPRHICKKVWDLPIPAYDESISDHVNLAELGIRCSEKVKKILPELDTKDITPGKIGRLRNQVRQRLSDELNEIDEIVNKILKK